MADTAETIERDYVDNFSIKELVIDNIMPEYFPDMDSDNLVAGTTGMLAEYVSTITEDAFNTGSSLVAEAFPSRAKMESSIYSNAAIFQLTNSFADAAKCNFVIVIPEADIRANFVSKEGSSYKYFYIDADFSVEVEDKVFSLDYDIEIRAMYRESKGAWIYSAKYLMDDFTNSVSDKTDPYVKLKQASGLIALTVEMGQYEREERYEAITDNATLNYPTIDVPYSGKLLGFDVLYKAPGDSDYNTQLTPKVMYSLPDKSPFVYFKPIDSETFQLSFTTKDAYFQPEFNSELKIIIYTTLASEGNFDYYDGDDYTVSKGDKYEYENSWMVVAKPIGAATGGAEATDIEGLQQLTVEGFSTANALTTENDLQLYFNNYDYRYKSKVLFLKKRNDAVELLFSAFMYIQNGDYIYPTNTLTMDTNVLEFEHKDGGFYNLDPGYLFSYKQDEIFLVPLLYYPIDGEGEYYDEKGHYYDKDGTPNTDLDIDETRLAVKIRMGTVKASDASYWKLSADDNLYHYTFSNGDTDDDNHPPITTEDVAKLYVDGSVTRSGIDADDKVFDFMKDTEKEDQARKDYLAFYETYKEREEKPNLTFDEYIFEYTYKDYKKEFGIDNRIMVFDVDFENFPDARPFMFTNPFITTITETTGLVSYFQTFISKNAELNFVRENDTDAFAQFIAYHLDVSRDISKDKKYNFRMEIMPSVEAEEGSPYIDSSTIYNAENADQFELYEGATPSLTNYNKKLLEKNRLRVIMTFINDDDMECGYMEMIPTKDIDNSDHYVFEAEFHTDDYITSANTFRVVHICPFCGNVIYNSANANIDDFDYYCDSCGKTFKEGIINIRENDTILLPIDGANIKITMIYKDPSNDADPITNNDFSEYHESFNGYVWTNVYNAQDDRLTFIKPLDMIRSVISYKDYYAHGVDALDCTISEMPLLKYSILAYKDTGMKITDPLLEDDIGKFQYFMDTFLGNYNILQEAKTYLGGMNIDAKFYNSYGKSTNFMIGDDRTEEFIDTNNISITLTITLDTGVDEYACETELKAYIKDYIEEINSDGTNELYVSNLIRYIEENFSYVNHMVFCKINNYDTTYQSIRNYAISLTELTKEERRHFVPDILTINKNSIDITFIQPES